MHVHIRVQSSKHIIYVCLLDSIWSHEAHAYACSLHTFIYNKEIILSFCMHVYTYIYMWLNNIRNIIIYIVVALYSYCLD